MVNSFEYRLLPGICLLCGAPSQRLLDLCSPCEQELPVLGPHCPCCALPLPAGHDHLCGQCLKKPPYFQRVIAIYRYQDCIPGLISQFKYRRQHSYGRVLAELLAQHLRSKAPSWPRPELLVAVPMHWRRRFHRGFNHCEQLATQLSGLLDIPHCRDVRRMRYSRPQQSLSASERRRNVHKTFRAGKAVRGKSVAIVDDVMTTGITANELAHTLLKAGARQVEVWCLARTPR